MTIVRWIYVLIFMLAPLATCKATEKLPEKRIVVLIPSYNNAELCANALGSVLMQDYSNWTAYFIDDASPNNDAAYARNFLAQYDPSHKITVIRNEINVGPLANQWRGQNNPEISNDTIIAFLDGDDQLAHKDVFNRLNQEYHNGAVTTFGTYVEWPSKRLGHCKEVPAHIVEANQWRDLPLPLSTSHLRTCYAGLIRQIPIHDLLYEGRFYPVSGDIAIFWPVLEMAGHRAKFISDITYVYKETEINEYKTRLPLVLNVYNNLKNKKRYKPLTDHELHEILTDHPKKEVCDLIIFSYNRPLQLYALLESLDTYVKGLGSVTVVYRADNDSYAHGYDIVRDTFPEIIFDEQSRINPQADFKEKTVAAFNQGSSDYILFAVDDIIVKDYIDLDYCIQALKQAHAYGFYLRLGKNITYSDGFKSSQTAQLLTLNNDICAWQFAYSQCDWAYPNSVDMTIFKKTDVQDALYALDYNNPSNLEGAWYIHEYIDFNKIGLCYDVSKIVNIPLNVVQTDRTSFHMNISAEYLLNLFNQGLKIDIKPLHKIINQSPHSAYELTCIPR